MGRLPTSGYCLTCRQRRVKCDRGKPTCQRCVKSGHRCQGYEGLVIRMDKKWCPPSTPVKTVTPLMRSPALLRVTSWGSAPVAGRQNRGPSVVPAATKMNGLSMPASSVTFDHLVSHFQWAPWWKFVLQMGLCTDPSGAAHKAASSLLTGYYAKHNGDEKVFLESRRYYGESLVLVSEALTFHTSESLPMMVLPIMIMSMHPYVFDSSVEFEHHIGLGVVLERCGPVNFQKHTDVFRSCRSIITCLSFGRRERTFLEDPEWQTVPFYLDGKNSMDYLYDTTVFIPGLFQDIHAMRAGTIKNDYAWMARRHRALEQELDVWHATWELGRPRAAEAAANRNANIHPFMAQYGTVDRAIEALAHFSSIIYLDKLAGLIAEGSYPEAETVTTLQVPSPSLVHMVRLCEWVTGELARPRTFSHLAPVPIAIIYCALKDLGGPGDELAKNLTTSCKVAKERIQYLNVYDIWRPRYESTAYHRSKTTYCRGDD
ncbi:hypothetical protein F5X68DRAFT_258308 [Plectosphaerella plurivora]|uniref:Zn(2)-C6 fungal-type domain-containing protein n=1 Tax=Plectosphaerella plurivora TaxID=936078 RepID=A0A9P8VNG1_9PEZI|nr:hypothetical protein F5X68DRAFT_258308 [Plectosphaerella plurivora]